MAGRRAVLDLQPQTESCTAVSSKATLSLGGARSVSSSVPGPPTSEPVASCSGAAFWSPQEPTCVLGGRVLQPPLCHWPALSSCVPVGLLILQVGDADFHLRVWSGLSGLSPGLSPALGLPGGWRPALAVWFAHAAVNAPPWNHTRHTHFCPPCRCWGRGRHSPGLQSAS